MNDVEKVVYDAAEEEGVLVYHVLKGKKDVSEFKLAEKIDKDINGTRRILYKLHSCGLASFIKKKDQKKGWYIYYWTFNEKQAIHLSGKETEKEDKPEKFICRNRCGSLEFEEAFDSGYKCPECGEQLNSPIKA